MIQKKSMMLAIAIVAAIALFLPHVIRLIHHNPYPIGAESHEVLWRVVLTRNGQTADPLTNQPLGFDLFTYFLTGFSFILRPEYLVVLPIIFGVVSSLIFFGILLRLRLSQEIAFFSALILTASPTFTFIFATATPRFLIFFAILLAIYFFFTKRFLASALLAGIVSMLDVVSGVLIGCFFLIFSSSHFMKHEERTALFRRIIPLFGFFLCIGLIFYDWRSLHPLFSIFLVDFGVLFGIDVPLLLLGVIGLIMVWKKTYLPVNLATLALFVISLFFPSVILFVVLLLAYYSGMFLFFLLSRSWTIPRVKQITLLLIVCTLLFSSLAYINHLSEEQPTPELVKAIEHIPPSLGMVLTHPSYEPFITYYAQKRVLGGDPAVLRELFSSRDLDRTEGLLKEYGVDTFFVTADMTHGLVWTKDEEGLLFLLRNSQHFVNVYSFSKDDQAYAVWAFRGKN